MSYPGLKYYKDDDEICFDLEYCQDAFMYFDTFDGDEIRYWPKFSANFEEIDDKDKIGTYDCTHTTYSMANEKWLRDLITQQIKEYKRLVNEWKKKCVAADFEP